MKINLLPEAKQIQRRIQKLNIMSTTIAVSVVVLFVVGTIVLLVVYKWNQAKLSTLNKEAISTKSEIDTNYKDLEKTVISLEKGVKNIKEILAGENKWSGFFKELEKSTPSDIQYNSLDIKGNKVKAILVGKDVNSLARFVRSLESYKTEKKKENLFNNVKVSGYKKEGTNIKFSAEFDINTEAIW